MQGKLKILFVSSEVSPFSKTGGLGDVSGALPKIIKELNHDIRIVMPKYGVINERRYVLREVIRLKEIKVPVGGDTAIANVKSSFLPNSKVQIYFVGNKEYFNRDGFYVDPETNKDFPDNAERFSFFSRSTAEILKKLHWQPDIIHCNDWQTALIPYYLKTIYNNDSFFNSTKTLLTIHNLAFQGVFDKSKLPLLNISPEKFIKGHEAEFWGKMNFLKAGIVYSDLINTVSKTYAKEIQTSEEFGFGLQNYLQKRSKDIYGIVNGIDYSEWNPETDENIPHRYSSNNLSEKMENKKALLASQGLKFNEKTPLIGIISRLTDQKGFDIFVEAIKTLMKMNVQFVILGIGETKYHDFLKKSAEKYPGKLALNLKFDNELAHQIEAGSDIFLMPSRFEPCGLNQIYSLKYGTIPIVRETGGLADTIKNYSSENDRGYGFVFNEHTAEELIKTVKETIKVFQHDAVWKKLMVRAMKLDFSWNKAGEKYIELYNKLIE